MLAATTALMTFAEFERLPDSDALFERWLAIPDEGYLSGAPEIVIEVLSPSNTASEILDKEQICLENGAREFWVVDPARSLVKVSTPDGHSVTYKRGQAIPPPFGGTLALDSIFG